MLRHLFLAACATVALHGATVDPFYAGNYTVASLGSIAGVSGNYGGVTFLDNSTLLIGSNANHPSATIQSVSVVRDIDGHIVSFGSPTFYASAPHIDGGLAFGPGGVLFAASYPNNTVMQFLPGSNTPDRVDTLPSSTDSTGTLQFVPSGYSGAGSFIIGGYTQSQWFTADLTADGNGTYDITNVTFREQGQGGPEGLIYVPNGSPLFGSNMALVSEYVAGSVGAYQIDSFGIPITASRTTFVTGLTGAEGATIDPVTGDFIFSTFNQSFSEIIQVRGFAVPDSGDVPEPATFALAGLALAGIAIRRRR